MSLPDSATRNPDATWHLRFDPAGMIFLTSGQFPTAAAQPLSARQIKIFSPNSIKIIDGESLIAQFRP